MPKGNCTVGDCMKPEKARKMCSTHYARWQRGVPLNAPVQAWRLTPEDVCIVDACDRQVRSRGRCNKHYQSWIQAQTPTKPRVPCKIEGCPSMARARGMCGLHGTRARKGQDLNAPRQKIYTPPDERWCVVEGCDRRSRIKRMCQMHYLRVRTHGDPFMYHGRSRGPHNLCEVEACSEQQKFKGMCRRHYERKKRGTPMDGPVFARRYVDPKSGYVYVRPSEGHPRRGPNTRLAEHRLVMERLIGRPLMRSESVHHKNGNRSDNRESNLELWVSTQPSGQRPADLLDWADEIIRLYRHLPDGAIGRAA